MKLSLRKIAPLMLVLVSACDTSRTNAGSEDEGARSGSSISDVSSEISIARLGRIESVLQEDVDAGLRAGYVTMIAKNGEVVYETAVGMADRENEIPMTKDTRFRIASMTKAIATVAVMQLVEDGAVLLNDPVSRFIPGFANMRVATSQNASAEGTFVTEPLERPITVHDLLTHTSGLDYAFIPETDLDKLYFDNNLYRLDGDLSARVDQLTTMPLYEQPGEKFRYSSGVDVAGRIVEIASGKSLEYFMRKRILGPLGMTDTEFFINESDFARLAVTYDVDEEGHLVRADNDPYILPPNTNAQGWMSAGGGLVSTTHDYMRFFLMILNEGELDGARILSPASVALMLRPHVTAGALHSDEYNMEGYSFGLGGYVIEQAGLRGETTANGQWGWAGYYDTMAFVSPIDELAVILMAQHVPWGRPPSRARGRVTAIAYGALEKNKTSN